MLIIFILPPTSLWISIHKIPARLAARGYETLFRVFLPIPPLWPPHLPLPVPTKPILRILRALCACSWIWLKNLVCCFLASGVVMVWHCSSSCHQNLEPLSWLHNTTHTRRHTRRFARTLRVLAARCQSSSSSVPLRSWTCSFDGPYRGLVSVRVCALREELGRWGCYEWIESRERESVQCFCLSVCGRTRALSLMLWVYVT